MESGGDLLRRRSYNLVLSISPNPSDTMKRYQCITNVEMLSLVGVSGSNGQIAFRQGRTYPSVGGHHIKDEFNNTWSVNHPVLVYSLQELLDINVDEPNESYHDHDAAEYDRFLSGLPSSRGCLIATAITIAFIATLILTWNS